MAKRGDDKIYWNVWHESDETDNMRISTLERGTFRRKDLTKLFKDAFRHHMGRAAKKADMDDFILTHEHTAYDGRNGYYIFHYFNIDKENNT